MKHVQVRYVGDRARVLEGYYDVIAKSHRRFGFLSPVKWPQWLDGVTEWICSGHRVAEVGCGRGELAAACLARQGDLQAYYLIDISQQMLNSARKRINKQQTSIHVEYLKLDMSSEPVPDIAAGSLDRVISINLMQDIADPGTVLDKVRGLLQVGGEFRATFINRDTQDTFWSDDNNYDTSEGRLYNYSSLHDEVGLPPLGYVMNDSEERAFYRVQTYYTESDIRALIDRSGLRLKSLDAVVFPIDIVMKRWNSKLHRTALDERQRALLDTWGGFPDSFDVVAVRE